MQMEYEIVLAQWNFLYKVSALLHNLIMDTI